MRIYLLNLVKVPVQHNMRRSSSMLHTYANMQQLTFLELHSCMMRGRGKNTPKLQDVEPADHAALLQAMMRNMPKP